MRRGHAHINHHAATETEATDTCVMDTLDTCSQLTGANRRLPLKISSISKHYLVLAKDDVAEIMPTSTLCRGGSGSGLSQTQATMSSSSRLMKLNVPCFSTSSCRRTTHEQIDELSAPVAARVLSTSK